jgi:tellurite methyltransferase
VPRNWEDYYSNPENLDHSPAPLLVEVAEWLPPGRALDLGCGAGRNALYLASLGWEVTAVDASPAALRALRQRAAGCNIEVCQADLESGPFRIAPERFDLICDFYYLQRTLFPAIRQGVKPGGVFVAAIHLEAAAGGPPPPAYRVQPGELWKQFADWKILFYSEAPEPGRLRPTARLAARRM